MQAVEGNDVTGYIESVGEGVTGFKKGDKVRSSRPGQYCNLLNPAFYRSQPSQRCAMNLNMALSEHED